MPASVPSNRRVILILVVLAAFLPEAITGSTPPLGWLNPFLVGLLLWLYGSGVLVCRELAIRWRAGWPGIVLLGAAYGIVEEGLTVKTMFDPMSPAVGDLGWYGHWAGVNWVWTVWLIIFHAAFSIAFPIFLVEWRWPALRGRPLLSRHGLTLAIALLAGVAILGQAILTPYRPAIPELVGAVLAILLLGWAAKGWAARHWARLPSGRLPSRPVYAAAGFAFFGVSFLVYAGGPALGGIPLVTFVEGGLLLAATLLLLRRASGRPDAERHVFAFAAGSIGFFALFAMILELAGKTGMSLVGIGFVLLVTWLYRRRAREAPAIAPSPPVPAQRFY